MTTGDATGGFRVYSNGTYSSCSFPVSWSGGLSPKMNIDRSRFQSCGASQQGSFAIPSDGNGGTIGGNANSPNAVLYADGTKKLVTLGGDGGTKITNLQDGVISSTSTDAVNGRQLNTVKTTADGAKTAATAAQNTANTANSTANTNKTNITALQAADALNVKYNAAKDTVALTGTGGSKITNLKDGTVSATSTDAVNGKQLFGVQTTANTAKTTADGARTTATAAQTTATAAQNTANTANSTANTNKTNITALQAADALNVKYNAAKDTVALAGTGGTKITNLKDGTVSATSTDAVNGKQLFGVQTTANTAKTTADG
ncbi:hypothetical protein FHQ26_10710, partial [Testudinibacter sp. TR-2022]